MKRSVEAPVESTVKSPESSKSDERQFSEDIEKMISRMSSLYRNQVLKALNKGTVAKFEDAQTGNFSRIFLGLAKKSSKSILKIFDDERIEKLVNKYTGRVDRRNKKELYRRVEESVGISRQELEATEGLTYQINAYKLETAQWVKKLRDETLELWTANTLRQMSNGNGLDTILSEFDDMVEKRKNHGKMVARTQMTSFNSFTTKARAQNLGITEAVWVTSSDERVRASHKSRNGKKFDLSEGLHSSIDNKTLLPGVDYQCRCDYKLVIPGMGDE